MSGARRPQHQRHPSLDDRFDPAVRIVAYDGAWPTKAAQELQRVHDALEDVTVRVAHVGSTAVPGLAAKPVLDLLLSVESLQQPKRYVVALEDLGYLFAPDPQSPGRHFFAKPPERPRSYHLHVVEAGSEDEVRHIAVRDFLRCHPDEVARYAALKRALVMRFPQDRLRYIEGKHQYVAALEQRAMIWACRRN